MGWLKDRWDAFGAAAEHRRYVIGSLLTVVIAFSDHLWPWLGTSITKIIGVPSWAVAIFVALVLVSYWLLEHLVQLRRRMRRARFALAKLRSSGVALRNEGMSLTTKAKWIDWQKRAEKWNRDVISNIKKNQ